MNAFPFTARDVAAAFGGDISNRDTAVIPGPGHSRKDRSLSVTVGQGADGFMVHSFAGDDPIACKDYVRQALGLPSFGAFSAARDWKPSPEVFEQQRKRIEEERQAQERKTALALQVWEQCQPAEGSLVETYLAGRKLALPPRAHEVIRFHPRCRFGPKESAFYLPAMVCLMRDVLTDEPRGIHRTALDPVTGSKSGHPGLNGDPRKVLGPQKGAAIKLCADDTVNSGLGVTEGVENGLAVITCGFRPVWSLINAAGVKAFPVLPVIDYLTIFADTDEAGLEAARTCGKRWIDAGREGEIRHSLRPGSDWNDLVEGRAV